MVLFQNVQNSLKDFIEGLTIEEIREEVGYAAFAKGEDYYENGHVKDVLLIQENAIRAEVLGSRRYTVNLYKSETEISGRCDCPVGPLCKHLVATLLHLQFEPLETLNTIDHNQVRKRLSQMEKSQLVALVIKYAPEEWLLALSNEALPDDKAKKIFEKEKERILHIFADAENLYEPEAFSAALDGHLKKIMGFAKTLPAETHGLLMQVLDKISDAMVNGYLYNHYYDDMYVPGEVFDRWVKEYALGFPIPERITFLDNLFEVLDGFSYDTFDHWRQLDVYFSVDDLNVVKPYVWENRSSMNQTVLNAMYGLLEEVLSMEEKKALLEILADNYINKAMALAALYRSEGEAEKTHVLLEKILTENKNAYVPGDVYIDYLDVVKEAGKDLKKAARKVMEQAYSEKIMLHINNIYEGDKSGMEKILKSNNPTGYFSYLQTIGRLDEALLMTKEGNNLFERDVFGFFKKHKKVFPHESEAYFMKTIDKNLQEASQENYFRIGEALSHLKVVNLKKALQVKQEIILNYKRRRNLMEVLNKV
jgi:hypothetical protein